MRVADGGLAATQLPQGGGAISGVGIAQRDGPALSGARYERNGRGVGLG